MVDLRLCFFVVVFSCMGGLVLSTDKQQLLERLHILKNILDQLNIEQGSEPNTLPSHLSGPGYYDEDYYENIHKRNPPAGFSAARGKRRFLLPQGGYASRSNSLDQFPLEDYNRDVIPTGQRDKKIPFHGGFMASRGKRSSSISKRSPVVHTLLNKSKGSL